jgi:hypothetical protein
MGEMSDVERYARAIEVDPRTARRHCQAGKIRAERHGRGWRIDEVQIQIAGMQRDLCKYFGPPTERNKRMFEATLFAHGIDIEDQKLLREYHQKLLRESPEKWRFLYLRYRHHEKAEAVADSRSTWLRFRIERQMKQLGRLPKFKELAEMLGVSVAQLYRAEPSLIKKLKRRYRRDDFPDGVASPIDLPGGVQTAPEAAVTFDYDAVYVAIDGPKHPPHRIERDIATERMKDYARWQVAMMDKFLAKQ